MARTFILEKYGDINFPAVLFWIAGQARNDEIK